MADDYVRVGLDADVFFREHLLPRRPVVLADVSGLRPGAEPWSPARLKGELGERELYVAEDERTVTLGAVLRKIARTERLGGDTSALPYTRNVWLLESLPELGHEVVEPFFAQPNLLVTSPLDEHVPKEWRPWRELFVSPPGVVYPEVHVDTHGTHAWLCQMWGAKRCWFWPPRHDALDARVRDTMKQLDVTPRTDLSRLFDHAPPVVVDLHAGQTAFVPAGWWHTTRTLELSITVSGNFLSPSCLDDFLAFVSIDDSQRFRLPSDVEDALRRRAEELTSETTEAAPSSKD